MSENVSTFSADNPAVPFRTISTSKIVHKSKLFFTFRDTKDESPPGFVARDRRTQVGLRKMPCSRSVTVPLAFAVRPVWNDCPEQRDASLTRPLSLCVLRCTQVLSVNRSSFRMLAFPSRSPQSQKQRRG